MSDNFQLIHHDFIQYQLNSAKTISHLVLLLEERAEFYRNVLAKGGKLVGTTNGHVVFTIPGHNTPTKEAEALFQTLAIDVSQLESVSTNQATSEEKGFEEDCDCEACMEEDDSDEDSSVALPYFVSCEDCKNSK